MEDVKGSLLDEKSLNDIKSKLDKSDSVIDTLKSLAKTLKKNSATRLFAARNGIIIILKKLLVLSKSIELSKFVAACIGALSLTTEILAIIEKENIIPLLVEIIKKSATDNGGDDDDNIYFNDNVITALGNICTIKVYAVKSMLLGSIPALIETVTKSLNNPTASERLNSTIYTITNHAFSMTVRDFISQILPQHNKELVVISSYISSPKIFVANCVAAMMAFFSLNNNNLPILEECNVFKKLKKFSERDPLELTERGFFITIEALQEGYLTLFASSFVGVTAYLLWVLARFSCGNPEITKDSTNIIPQYIKKNLLPLIRMYCHHSDKRTRELALMILKNVDDTTFLSEFENLQNWINGLDIISTDKQDTLKKLGSANVSLDSLLDPRITLDQTLATLQRLDIIAGTTLKMIASLFEARKNNENARQLALEIVNAIKTKERELAINIEKKINFTREFR